LKQLSKQEKGNKNKNRLKAKELIFSKRKIGLEYEIY
jgi:hypothetical protein